MNNVIHTPNQLPIYKLAIVIPVRNEEHVIHSIIYSLTNQSLESSKYNVILVDDNSSDGSYEKIFQHIKHLNNFYLTSNKIGRGVTSTRISGYEYVIARVNSFIPSFYNTELVVNLDADSIIGKNLLSTYYTYMEYNIEHHRHRFKNLLSGGSKIYIPDDTPPNIKELLKFKNHSYNFISYNLYNKGDILFPTYNGYNSAIWIRFLENNLPKIYYDYYNGEKHESPSDDWTYILELVERGFDSDSIDVNYRSDQNLINPRKFSKEKIESLLHQNFYNHKWEEKHNKSRVYNDDISEETLFQLKKQIFRGVLLYNIIPSIKNTQIRVPFPKNYVFTNEMEIYRRLLKQYFNMKWNYTPNDERFLKIILETNTSKYYLFYDFVKSVYGSLLGGFKDVSFLPQTFNNPHEYDEYIDKIVKNEDTLKYFSDW